MIETLIGGMIGKEMYNQAIAETTHQLYSEINYLISYNDFNFKSILENLDIINKIEIINDLLKNYDNITDKSIEKCVKSVIDIIHKINNEINEIKVLIEQHEEKWFYKWRSNPYSRKIENLINHSKIMDNRLDLLIKIINLSKI